ncbi:hypothetical protein OESDEN_00576 [Oesophagostomum dentatum]|uniref:ABC-2 type transporter transmembrane domain-containing protein n=1 Tax=Oesophagostomum dentatum TaxID=61180 RepID=A0A0B1TPE6_OESDE|nr:hypothetical protein OESDEN_00576 [Oesophagostomum dentatum]
MTILREPTLLKVQIMQSIVIAVLTGVIYLNDSYTQEKVQNINGSLYQLVVNMAFMFQFAVVNHFCSEVHTFFREYSSGLYSVSSYFIAKNLAEATAQLHSVRDNLRRNPLLDVAADSTLGHVPLLPPCRCACTEHRYFHRLRSRLYIWHRLDGSGRAANLRRAYDGFWRFLHQPGLAPVVLLSVQISFLLRLRIREFSGE